MITKYDKGDEVTLKGVIKAIVIDDERSTNINYRVEVRSKNSIEQMYFTEKELDEYTMVQNTDTEVWEFFREVGTGPGFWRVYHKYLDEVLTELSFEEAKEIWEKYKQDHTHMAVGDEVQVKDDRDGLRGVVIKIPNAGVRIILWGDGTISAPDVEDIMLTGVHYDDVDNLLKKMNVPV